MKFSTKSRYALRLMAELARYAPGSTVSLKEISERQQLSLKYLEQIVTPLARVGLVKSERGSQGGYRLTKAPADYTAGEILRAIEGSVAPIPCLGSETNECPMSDQCFLDPGAVDGNFSPIPEQQLHTAGVHVKMTGSCIVLHNRVLLKSLSGLYRSIYDFGFRLLSETAIELSEENK